MALKPLPAKPREKHRFSDILADAEVAARFQKVREWFFLRESTYDVTSRCNLHCQGCYYYQGEKQHARPVTDPARWGELLRREKERGITFVVLAGAEPALEPAILAACYQEISLGCIATNGLKVIPPEVDYRIHLSVWGDDATSQRVRGARDMLARQLAGYQGDERAVFVYTFTPHNIAESHGVVERLARAGCQVTFNVFSAPEGYTGDLRHTAASLHAMRQAMLELLDAFPEHVLFSPYNAQVHAHPAGLHRLFGCSYPRQNESSTVGLGRTFRQYRTDLAYDRAAGCCVPDTTCDDCRHYAAGSAVVTARLFRHATHPETFRAWLDYVDTYLAVWVRGYPKGRNLCPELTAPPGPQAD
ncbi:MAG: radical SAM protein [Deltaproteobacteria bacterium]|nr:radical SAM protein [Deltaproteobacteria bacterium]